MAHKPSHAEAATSLLAPLVAAAGLVLESVVVTPAGKRRVVRVVVDLPAERTDSLDLDAVAEISRAVSQALDDSEPAGPLGGAPYVLEVTTPGVDRPLTEHRHWARARGRLVRTTIGAEPATGRVLSVDAAGVLLQDGEQERTVSWPDLGSGHVQVEFKRPPGAGGPQDDSDPDDSDPDDSDPDDSDEED